LIESPDDAGWCVWYALLRSGGLEAATVVGAGGFFGPPNAEGVVEIGYSIVSAFNGRGYATELVRALVKHAFQSGRVTRVVAHTTMDNTGSVRVLEKAGFGFVGPGREVGTVEYALQFPET
jgi:RimJ/RimL family protein N-acetyltransferase